ncbi:hypothetical protein DFH08DRAFT_860840 [Mycena albidolilacea]|uniref:Uncharacterized protein n=1 Tax=Mycena albidolilacea TaxID=1033008 RepID=A0AAD7A604_9AGAR|nr:hypothetical protein DFH08DRAFT_860840 [Mycena albidolilacea]
MNQAFKQAVSATVQRLQNKSTTTTFLPQRLLLVGQGVAAPTDQLAADLESLAATAQSAATSVLCSSILAGHTSESDDFGDAAIWLGQGAFGKGHEQAVLSSLGIQGGRISPVELSPKTYIPKTVNASSITPELAALSAKLAELQDLHCFSLQTSSSDVIYSLVGKNSNGWAGLVGIGTWSDE